MARSLITVFGGSGFLGRRIVAALRAAGMAVRVAVRHPDRATLPDHTEIVHADVRIPETVSDALTGAAGAVNCVGLYVERGGDNFEAVHVRGARHVCEQAARAGIERLVHISGIGADSQSRSAYVRARGRGEVQLRQALPSAVILRPSALFGPRDALLASLDAITRLSPVMPLFGAGRNRLQPVYVGDVAAAVVRSLKQTESAGRTFELGGPEVFTYRELVEAVLEFRARRRLLLRVPFWLWDIQARILSLLPNPPLTRDQVALMREDNIARPDAPGFPELGIEPRSLKTLLPVCLGDEG